MTTTRSAPRSPTPRTSFDAIRAELPPLRSVTDTPAEVLRRLDDAFHQLAPDHRREALEALAASGHAALAARYAEPGERVSPAAISERRGHLDIETFDLARHTPLELSRLNSNLANAMHSGFLDRDGKLGIGAKLYPDLQVEVHAWPDGFVALESAREGCRGGEAGRMQIVPRDRTVRTLSDAERTQLRAWVDTRLADWKSNALVARAHAPRLEKLEELARRMDL